MTDNADETNIAATLRDIAANCDQTTGQVLKQCTKAAHQGKDHVIVRVSEDDRDYLNKREHNFMYGKPPITPLVEKLESLGFKLQSTDMTHWLYDTRCYIKVSW